MLYTSRLPLFIPKPLIRHCVPRIGKQSYRKTLSVTSSHNTSGLAKIHRPIWLPVSSRHIPPSSYPSTQVLRPGSRVVCHYDTFSPFTSLLHPNTCRVLSVSLLHLMLRTVFKFSYNTVHTYLPNTLHCHFRSIFCFLCVLFISSIATVCWYTALFAYQISVTFDLFRSYPFVPSCPLGSAYFI